MALTPFFVMIRTLYPCSRSSESFTFPVCRLLHVNIDKHFPIKTTDVAESTFRGVRDISLEMKPLNPCCLCDRHLRNVIASPISCWTLLTVSSSGKAR